MFLKKSKKPQSRIDSLIGGSTRVEGNIIFSGGLRVDGEVKGNVRVEENKSGTLVISEQARIEGEVHVSHVVINGTVDGPVHAGEFLELQSNARVAGDVHYSNLEMHLGAVVQGRLVHQDASGKAVELKLASSH